MKATTTAIDLAASSKETLLRIGEAVTEATKRLAELTSHPDAKTPRHATAIVQIQEAMKFADATRKTVARLAGAGLSLQPKAAIELGELELAALSYGMLPVDAS